MCKLRIFKVKHFCPLNNGLDLKIKHKNLAQMGIMSALRPGMLLNFAMPYIKTNSMTCLHRTWDRTILA